MHTCDERSNKSVIQATYRECGTYERAERAPAGWHIDDSFPFYDPLWDPIYEETDPLLGRRVRNQLNDVFAEDPSTFISITVHSGTISGFFLAVGHQKVSVQTGGFLPVLVRSQPGNIR